MRFADLIRTFIGRSHRPTTKTRDEYEPWLRDYLRKRAPELEPLLVAAFDAYDVIVDERRIDPSLLGPIVEGASSWRRPVLETAVGLLGKLARDYALARDAVDKMAVDPRSYVRFNAILCLEKTTPIDFTLKLLRQGLRDKSAGVRSKAADWAGRLRLRELVPDLEDALAVETRVNARETI